MARIMVVEDEPITAADLEQKLCALGHEVTACLDTGEEAVIEGLKQSPDLVLMDIRLRGAMSGIEAAERLRAGSDVPLVFLTAFADQETVDRACETRPYGYLLKPFTERAVATAVQVALARARADKKHVERERWAAAALRGTQEALVAVDEAGLVRFLNEHAELLLEVKERDALGKAAVDVVRFAGATRSGPDGPLEAALREGRITSAFACAIMPAGGGAPTDVSLNAAPVFAARGKRAGAVLLFRKVQAPASAPAPDSEQLEVLRAFSMQLSHEINNPLTYNLGALHLALMELDQLRAMSALGVTSDAATAQHEQQLLHIERLLRDAQEGATRVAGVMRELGSLSLAEWRPSPLRPIELLDLAIGFSGIEDVEHLRLVRHVDPAPMVRVNKWQLARLLAEALRNVAERHDPQVHGELTLELGVTTDAHGWAEIRAHARHGPEPAPSSERPSPARRTSSRPPSVGTTVASRLVEALGGKLTFREQPDGPVVVLSLPPMREAAPEVAADAGTEPTQVRRSVLVIDDEPMLGRVIEIALQPAHDVTVVGSAQHALALLERGNAFDVILCDLSMPGMDGQDLYERLCETRPEIARRVVLMSGGATTARGARFLESMRGRWLEKPFAIDRLLPLLTEGVGVMRTDASQPPP